MADFKAGDQVKARSSALADYPQLVNQVGSVYSVDRDGISVEFDGSLVDGELVFLPHELIKVKSLPAAEARVKALRQRWGGQKALVNIMDHARQILSAKFPQHRSRLDEYFRNVGIKPDTRGDFDDYIGESDLVADFGEFLREWGYA